LAAPGQRAAFFDCTPRPVITGVGTLKAPRREAGDSKAWIEQMLSRCGADRFVYFVSAPLMGVMSDA
jgi:hypothetical protein